MPKFSTLPVSTSNHRRGREVHRGSWHSVKAPYLKLFHNEIYAQGRLAYLDHVDHCTFCCCTWACRSRPASGGPRRCPAWGRRCPISCCRSPPCRRRAWRPPWRPCRGWRRRRRPTRSLRGSPPWLNTRRCRSRCTRSRPWPGWCRWSSWFRRPRCQHRAASNTA